MVWRKPTSTGKGEINSLINQRYKKIVWRQCHTHQVPHTRVQNIRILNMNDKIFHIQKDLLYLYIKVLIIHSIKIYKIYNGSTYAFTKTTCLMYVCSEGWMVMLSSSIRLCHLSLLHPSFELQRKQALHKLATT